ncbi:hypothetical protein BHE74_00037232 [Ensete ventricosum]|uniref:Uncharacterized protein n=1 Tax=Ensete ventricosum TaxID=4639 RepID=A0A444E7X1_ENSVE|nr:hypothetical protein GW17_00030195 [Ensete ventricosum]RWW56082.1 hypothetical protein BHE74_00037232 [Ensete ventricosum]RZR74861.1 hypothetical protein BHM03_00045021 [Ensete ventricosum]
MPTNHQSRTASCVVFIHCALWARRALIGQNTIPSEPKEGTGKHRARLLLALTSEGIVRSSTTSTSRESPTSTTASPSHAPSTASLVPLLLFLLVESRYVKRPPELKISIVEFRFVQHQFVSLASPAPNDKYRSCHRQFS